jgi:hypothetical protein
VYSVIENVGMEARRDASLKSHGPGINAEIVSTERNEALRFSLKRAAVFLSGPYCED